MYEKLTTNDLRTLVRKLDHDQREANSAYAMAARSLKRRLRAEREQKERKEKND